MQKFLNEIQIKRKVCSLAKNISGDYIGKDLVLVGVLKGAAIFLADLIREISIPASMDFVEVSSYGSRTKSSGRLKIIKDIGSNIEGRDVLIVEDIIDTGKTLKHLNDSFKKRKAKSVKICVLLDKPSRREVDINIDYRGFTVPDKFIVGYGLDNAEKFRGLPYIAYL